MAEKPIIFNGEMVRAILECRKTQTRRVIKPQPEIRGFSNLQRGPFGYWGECRIDQFIGFTGHIPECPYGQPGDILWVRETWGINDVGDIAYRANGEEPLDGDGFIWTSKWKPSIHMPRKFARIFLTVKDVRVERVQDISEMDALAEGIYKEKVMRSGYSSTGRGDRYPYKYEDYVCRWRDGEGKHCGTARGAFANLWNSINETHGFGWEANPWVWVIEFELKEIKEE
jgi:hypothetical protein